MANVAPRRTGNDALLFSGWHNAGLIWRATHRDIELTLPLPEDALPTNPGIDPQYQYRLDAQPTNALDKPAIRPTSPKLIPASYAEPPP